MLQEELRRYRSRVGEQEGLLLAADRTIVSLRDELARERQHLRECAVSPAQVLQDQKFRQALEERCGRGCCVCWGLGPGWGLAGQARRVAAGSWCPACCFALASY